MGEPASCERTSAETGDSLQQTTHGLARYLKRLNLPTFTSGAEHWALTARGLVYWVGRSMDVPDDAQLVSDQETDTAKPEAATSRGKGIATDAGRDESVAFAVAIEPAWLERPLQLVAEYDYRHGTLLSKAIQMSTIVVTDAPGLWAAFVPQSHTLVITPVLKTESAEAVASVLAHEGLHAVDIAKYGAPRDDVACYTYETSAFRLQAAVWQSFYGDAGKPDPGTQLEHELNEILQLARADSWRFLTDIHTRYRDECS